jgi:hypothetical protein
LRIHLVSGATGAAYADVDLTTAVSATSTLGRAGTAHSDIAEAADGWFRAYLSAKFDEAPSTLLFQLRDADGNAGFAPGNQSIFLRAIQVERGQTASAYRPPPAIPLPVGTETNLLAATDGLAKTTEIASLALAPDGGGAEYILAARGLAGEHYVILETAGGNPGAYVLSFDAANATSPAVRAQLFDDGGSGIVFDVNLLTLAAVGNPVGTAGVVSAHVGDPHEGWQTVRLAADLPGVPVRVLLQLLDENGGASFSPDGHGIRLRNIELRPLARAAEN